MTIKPRCLSDLAQDAGARSGRLAHDAVVDETDRSPFGYRSPFARLECRRPRCRLAAQLPTGCGPRHSGWGHPIDPGRNGPRAEYGAGLPELQPRATIQLARSRGATRTYRGAICSCFRVATFGAASGSNFRRPEIALVSLRRISNKVGCGFLSTPFAIRRAMSSASGCKARLMLSLVHACAENRRFQLRRVLRPAGTALASLTARRVEGARWPKGRI